MPEYDVYLLAGTVLACVGAVSIFSATVDGRRPFFGVVLVLLGCASIYMASTLAPQGMKFVDIPNAFIRLAGMLFN